MRTRILKKEPSLKVLPLFALLFLIPFGLVVSAQNCRAMETDSLLNDESKPQREEQRPITRLSTILSSGADLDSPEEEISLSKPYWDPIEETQVKHKILEQADREKALADRTAAEKKMQSIIDFISLYHSISIKKNTKTFKRLQKQYEREVSVKIVEDLLKYLENAAWNAIIEKPTLASYMKDLREQKESLIVDVESLMDECASLRRENSLRAEKAESHLNELEKPLELEKQNVALKRALPTERSELAEMNKQLVPDQLESEKETFVVLGNGSQEFLEEEEENANLPRETEKNIEKSKELIRVLKDMEEIKGFIEENKQRVIDLKKTLADLQGEVEELLSEKERLSQEKEELTRGNDALDLTLDEATVVKQLDLLKEQMEGISMKKLEPQIKEQIEALKSENQQLSKKNIELDNEVKARTKKISELRGEKQRLVETNQDLSKKVSFLVWGGVSCAAIAVFYMILQRGK